MAAYTRGKLLGAVGSEKSGLERKAAKKGLWGSIGRTVGSLGVMALTGGAVNPVTLGLLTGAASFAGGAIGARAAGGKLTGGRFFKSDRASLQKELGAFGSANITESLKSGIKSGIGQKLKLMKSEETAAKGLDFEGSMVGKGLEKRAIGKAREELQKMGEASIGGGPSFAEGTGKSIKDSLAQGPPASWELDRMPSRRHAQFAPGEMTSIKEAADIRSKYTDVILGEAGMSDSAADLGLLDPDVSTYYKDETASVLSNLRTEAGYDKGFDRSSMLREQQKSIWEGLGKGFPVSSPDLIPVEYGSEKVRAIGASQYSAGKSATFDVGRHKEMQDMMSWQKRLRLE